MILSRVVDLLPHHTERAHPVFKTTTFTVLALAVAGLAAGNAHSAAYVKVPLKSSIMKLPVTTPVAPRIKLETRGKLGCNEISRTIIFNGQAYTATKCR